MKINRICATCKDTIEYKTKSQYNEALKNNRICKTCSNKIISGKRKYNGSLTKICVKCKITHTFSSLSGYRRADRGDYMCKSCVIKKIHKGKKLSKETKKKISNANLGKIHPKEVREKLSKLNSGKNNPMYGRTGSKSPMFGKCGELSPTYGKSPWNKGLKGSYSKKTIEKMKLAKKGKYNGKNNPNYGNHSPLSIDHKRKLRLSHIKRVEIIRNNGYQLTPNFNINACRIIEEYGKKNGYNFRHAMNGGEFYIKELGYWVDGYDKDKNVVIEYMENDRHHYDKNGNIKKRDIQRMDEIKKYLNCNIILLEEKYEYQKN